MHPLVVVAFSLTLLAGTANGQSCNATNLCPGAVPCCSEFGFCGTGAFCLGGCNPLGSNSVNSCKPSPICQDAVHNFTDNSRILSNATLFDGNATEYDWVVDQGNVINTNSSGGELALLLTQENGGTRMSSTRYVHYGTITTRMKSGRWAGVVAAFITMSDIKDEIDWEFPGNSTTTGAQTNYFWQGNVPTPTNGEAEQGVQDTFGTYHDYTIDWQPNALTFLVDGKVVRTVQQSSTVDSHGVSHYPSTPSRIQLSLWPAGIPGVADGTVQWADGMIDWNDPDYLAAGHFYTLIQSVTVKCADPNSPAPSMLSYVYGKGTTSQKPTIFLSDRLTTLLSKNGARSALGNGHQFRGALVGVAGLMMAFYVL